MRKAIPIFALLATLIVLLLIRLQNMDVGHAQDEVVPATLEIPSPGEVVKPSMQRTQAQPSAKTSQRIKRTDQEPSIEQTLEEHSRSVLAKAQPAKTLVEPTEQKQKQDSKWLPSQRLRKSYGIQAAKAEPIRNACDTEECQNVQKGYSLVGVVINPHAAGSADKVMDGAVDVGDAKRVPFLHLK